jgi:sensor histidine kinase regulating citrate/malate metabolism
LLFKLLAGPLIESFENAIDAGANQIDLVLRDSGKSLIQVIDNGCGMDRFFLVSKDEKGFCRCYLIKIL